MSEYEFTTEDLIEMQATQAGHMLDICKIRARVQTVDTYGEPVETFPVDSQEVECGLDMRPGNERHTSEGNTIIYDATIRLPIDTELEPTERIKVTKRFGQLLETPLIYEVVSPIQRGPSGIRYALRRLEK